MNTAVIVLISFFLGSVYALLLYSKKYPWKKRTNIALGILRFSFVFGLCYLILSPFLKTDQTTIEKSSLIIAIDNSLSIKDALKGNTNTLIEKIEQIKVRYADKFDVKFFTLNGQYNEPLSKLAFNKKDSNIEYMLNAVNSNFAATDVKAILLFTDGIINKGNSPLNQSYTYPIYSVGIGDTSIPKDIIVKNCLFNQIVGLNNRFPIEVEVKAFGFKGKNISVSLFEGKNKIQNKILNITSDRLTQSTNFESAEKTAGLKHYTIKAETIKGEYSTSNNSKDIYFDVIEAKQKIAVMSSVAHPDVKAIAASLSKNENAEVQIFVEGIHQIKSANFDLVIACQLPSFTTNFNNQIRTFAAQNTPILYVLGGNSNLSELNSILPNFKLLPFVGQFDKVNGQLNEGFSRFNFTVDINSFLAANPPLIVPFGEYNLGQGWEIVLFQKVGSVITTKPLLALYANEGKNMGVIFGEGLWQWRMNEFALHQNNIAFDELFTKIATLLAQKSDKRKFKCETLEKNFEENTPITFKIETYNDIYEPIFNKEIAITIKDDNKHQYNYKFINSVETPNFEIAGLPSGAYQYTATINLAGKELSTKGEFSIQNMNLEDVSKVADFELLRNMATQTGGEFTFIDQFENLKSKLDLVNPDKKIFKTENVVEIINLPILFFILLTLISVEWAVRKSLGEV